MPRFHIETKCSKFLPPPLYCSYSSIHDLGKWSWASRKSPTSRDKWRTRGAKLSHGDSKTSRIFLKHHYIRNRFSDMSHIVFDLKKVAIRKCGSCCASTKIA